jgi:hypothetical protein
VSLSPLPPIHVAVMVDSDAVIQPFVAVAGPAGIDEITGRIEFQHRRATRQQVPSGGVNVAALKLSSTIRADG